MDSSKRSVSRDFPIPRRSPACQRFDLSRRHAPERFEIQEWFSSYTFGARLSHCPPLIRNVSPPLRIWSKRSLRTRGCWLRPATRRSPRLVRLSLFPRSQQMKFTDRTDSFPWCADELPALKDGATWVSKFRNIVDYLRQCSNGAWDLDARLEGLERADSIAYVMSRKKMTQGSAD
jgi:hypothetical protein